MLEFKKVTKHFGDIEALNDISFAIKDGEFVVLTGPSGSGKTTILKLLIREFPSVLLRHLPDDCFCALSGLVGGEQGRILRKPDVSIGEVRVIFGEETLLEIAHKVSARDEE